MAMRVLLTGAGGFTGQYVAAALRTAGHEVLALSSAAGERIDLQDASALGEAVDRLRPQAVIHLAAIAYVAHDDVDAIYRTNLLGARHLLAALAQLPEPPRRVILASSANVYGNAGAAPIAETHFAAPLNDYAVSKLAMEYMAATWRERLPIVIVRPFNYTGVGQDVRFLIPKIVDHYRRRAASITLGNLDVWRDFLDVRDVARLYAALLQVDQPPPLLNLCSGRSHALREVIATMDALAGYAIQVESRAALVRGNELHRLEGDPSLLRATLGDTPLIPWEETLRWMLQAA